LKLNGTVVVQTLPIPVFSGVGRANKGEKMETKMNKTTIIALLICTAAFAQQKSKVEPVTEKQKATAMEKIDWGPQAIGTGNTGLKSLGPAPTSRLTPGVKLSDAEMFRQNVFQLDEIYHCMYDDKTGTWDMKPETGWTMTGHYDLKGETKGKVRDVSIKYYQQYNANLNSKCTVEPEWGNSYIDEDCKKKYIETFKEDLYNIVYKKRFEGKNIYKICANRCGGGLGYCDESMYW